MQYGGFISHRYLCQQKPVVSTPTGKKFQHSRGKPVKKFRSIFTEILYLIHPTPWLLFSLCVNTLGKIKSLLPRAAVKCTALKNLAYSPVSTSGMGDTTRWTDFFGGCCISSDPVPKPV